MFPDLLEKKICSTLLAARNRWSFLDLGVILHTAAGRPAQLPAAAPAARAASGSCKNGLRYGALGWWCLFDWDAISGGFGGSACWECMRCWTLPGFELCFLDFREQGCSQCLPKAPLKAHLTARMAWVEFKIGGTVAPNLE